MIKQLTIKNIRGVKRLNIDIDKKPMLIFGENGKGKSSIIDAIEWALTGKISHRNDNGCHYNEWAEGRSSDEVKDFANAIIDFYNSVCCTKCGDYVTKFRVINKDEFYCRCKNISYLPSMPLA